jgi:hypothetical protein
VVTDTPAFSATSRIVLILELLAIMPAVIKLNIMQYQYLLSQQWYCLLLSFWMKINFMESKGYLQYRSAFSDISQSPDTIPVSSYGRIIFMQCTQD